MLEFLQSADKWLFYAVNSGWVNPVFDAVLPFITEASNFRIPVLIFFVGTLIWGGKKGRIFVAVLLLCVAITDPVNSRLIKEWFARPRPCASLGDVRLLIMCGAGKSFMSSHAANMFAVAVIVGRFYPNFFRPTLAFAAFIAFSRVYCGVHYPADVVAGALFGASVALLLLAALSRILRRFPKFAFPPFA